MAEHIEDLLRLLFNPEEIKSSPANTFLLASLASLPPKQRDKILALLLQKGVHFSQDPTGNVVVSLPVPPAAEAARQQPEPRQQSAPQQPLRTSRRSVALAPSASRRSAPNKTPPPPRSRSSGAPAWHPSPRTSRPQASRSPAPRAPVTASRPPRALPTLPPSSTPRQPFLYSQPQQQSPPAWSPTAPVPSGAAISVPSLPPASLPPASLPPALPTLFPNPNAGSGFSLVPSASPSGPAGWGGPRPIFSSTPMMGPPAAEETFPRSAPPAPPAPSSGLFRESPAFPLLWPGIMGAAPAAPTEADRAAPGPLGGPPDGLGAGLGLVLGDPEWTTGPAPSAAQHPQPAGGLAVPAGPSPTGQPPTPAQLLDLGGAPLPDAETIVVPPADSADLPEMSRYRTFRALIGSAEGPMRVKWRPLGWLVRQVEEIYDALTPPGAASGRPTGPAASGLLSPPASPASRPALSPSPAGFPWDAPAPAPVGPDGYPPSGVAVVVDSAPGPLPPAATVPHHLTAPYVRFHEALQQLAALQQAAQERQGAGASGTYWEGMRGLMAGLACPRLPHLEAMPHLLMRHFSKRYGIRSLVEQSCWDLLANVEAHRAGSLEAELFGRFLHPSPPPALDALVLPDSDPVWLWTNEDLAGPDLLFYLHARLALLGAVRRLCPSSFAPAASSPARRSPAKPRAGPTSGLTPYALRLHATWLPRRLCVHLARQLMGVRTDCTKARTPANPCPSRPSRPSCPCRSCPLPLLPLADLHVIPTTQLLIRHIDIPRLILMRHIDMDATDPPPALSPRRSAPACPSPPPAAAP
ncbi:hypothetical protein PAPYR_5324 [Paratrimastix pyriformis]|uniref:Uncharacterized protein n=1 Tax=Paratrimastix pyriformis TaxID=342808 RepID=A0ABQ8UM79_9EUKA|nr:hypothetical protein PAPYR_5324 [Paratrimastix pyriformis]